jgi:hypothetical protein
VRLVGQPLHLHAASTRAVLVWGFSPAAMAEQCDADTEAEQYQAGVPCR